MPIEYPKEFFKILQNHELHNGELRLPKKFVEKHWKGISNSVVLRLPNRDEHKISWVKREGDIWLQKNWENIAKFLKYGDVVVFNYIGGSKFKVKIFGLNTLEIDYSNIPKFIDEESFEAREVFDESDGEMNGVGTSQRRKTSKRKMNVDFDSTQQKFSGSKSGAVNMNPSFEVKLSKSYVLPHGETLRLPSDFSQKYLNGYNGTASIRVDENMAKEVNVRFQDIDSNRTSFITKGWKPFIEEYNLQVDDKCKFEMIQQQPLSFSVTIIRAREVVKATKKGKEIIEVTDESDDDTVQAQKTRNGKRKFQDKNKGNRVKKSQKYPTNEAVNDENPYFEVVMTKSYAHGSFMWIPKKFSTEYLHNFNGISTLRVGKDTPMKVNVKFHDGIEKCMMVGGWKRFSKKYNLQVDDPCKFVMTRYRPPSFDVIINRARKGPSPKNLRDSEGGNVKKHFTFKINVKNKNYPDLPKKFINLGCDDNHVKLTMGRELWSVKVKYFDGINLRRFGEGWRPFINECNLIGKTCLFELIDEKNLVFSVSVEE